MMAFKPTHPEDTAIDLQTMAAPVPVPLPSVPSLTEYIDEADRAAEERNRRDSIYQEVKKKPLFLRFFHKRLVLLWVVASIVPMLYGFLYVGAVWDPKGHLEYLQVGIYNADQGFNLTLAQQTMPPAVYTAFSSLPFPDRNGGAFLTNTILAKAGTLFYWRVYNYTLPAAYTSEEAAAVYQDAVSLVEKGKLWAVLYIPPNHSQNLFSASTVNATGSPLTLAQLSAFSNTVQIIFDQGRNYATLQIVVQALESLLNSISYGVSSLILTKYAAIPGLLSLLNPIYVSHPVQYEEVNLYPVNYYGLNFASYIMPVVLWIGAMINMVIIMRYTTTQEADMVDQSALEAPTDKASAAHAAAVRKSRYAAFRVVLVRVCIGLLYSFCQAISVTLIPVILGAPDQVAQGYGKLLGFEFLLGLSFLSLNGMICALVGYELFQVPATLLLIIQLTSSAGILSEEVMSRFFRVGNGLPFYYGVLGNRYLLFGSREDQLGKACGIIVAYAIGCGLITLFLGIHNVRKRWKAVRASRLGQLIAAGVQIRIVGK